MSQKSNPGGELFRPAWPSPFTTMNDPHATIEDIAKDEHEELARSDEPPKLTDRELVEGMLERIEAVATYGHTTRGLLVELIRDLESRGILPRDSLARLMEAAER